MEWGIKPPAGADSWLLAQWGLQAEAEGRELTSHPPLPHESSGEVADVNINDFRTLKISSRLATNPRAVTGEKWLRVREERGVCLCPVLAPGPWSSRRADRNSPMWPQMGPDRGRCWVGEGVLLWCSHMWDIYEAVNKNFGFRSREDLGKKVERKGLNNLIEKS